MRFIDLLLRTDVKTPVVRDRVRSHLIARLQANNMKFQAAAHNHARRRVSHDFHAQALLQKLPGLLQVMAFHCTVRKHVGLDDRSEEHTSELQSLMRISYAVFCLTKKTKYTKRQYNTVHILIY